MNERADIPKLVKRLHDNVQKEMNNVLATYDVTFSQLQMLYAIRTMGGVCTLKELEHHFHLAQSSIAGVAKRLEEKHLLQGFTDKSDRRIKHVRLTEDGERLCLDCDEVRKAKEGKLTSCFSDEEVRQFVEYLGRVISTFE